MSKHILIADDDHLFVDILRMGFEKHAGSGYTVSAVENGQHTIKMLSERKPDMLILDLRMPNLDGYGVLQHMKENHTSVPVIIVTYYQDDMHKKKAEQFGVKSYLVKSDWKIEQLVNEIVKHLAAA